MRWSSMGPTSFISSSAAFRLPGSYGWTPRRSQQWICSRVKRAGAVVSGLPLLAMRPKKVLAVFEGAFRHLREDGAFYQFTYGPRCPISPLILNRLGLRATRIGRVFANMPPAGIYRNPRGKRDGSWRASNGAPT